jgi:hypothetical protein
MRPHRRHQTAELEPVLLRHVAHGDCHQARQTRFGRQCVVAGRIPPAFGDVVADREEVPFAIEQEVELGCVDELLESVVKTRPPCVASRAASRRPTAGIRRDRGAVA